MRIAIVVGAEIATRMGIPGVAAFSTISKLQRLVISAKPASRVNAIPRHGSDQLVEGVMAADIFAGEDDFARRPCPSGVVDGAVC